MFSKKTIYSFCFWANFFKLLARGCRQKCQNRILRVQKNILRKIHLVSEELLYLCCHFDWNLFRQISEKRSVFLWKQHSTSPEERVGEKQFHREKNIDFIDFSRNFSKKCSKFLEKCFAIVAKTVFYVFKELFEENILAKKEFLLKILDFARKNLRPTMNVVRKGCSKLFYVCRETTRGRTFA